MNNDCLFQELNLLKPSTTIKKPIKVECQTPLETEQVSRILSVNANPVIIKTTKNDNVTTLEGKVNFFVCYVDNENDVKKTECSSDFTQDFTFEQDCNAHFEVVCEKTEIDASGLKLTIGANLVIKASLSEIQKINCLTGGNNLVVNPVEVQVPKRIGVCESVYPVEEEFEVDYAVDCSLSQRLSARITAVQCGVGSVIVDGEAEVCIIFLQKGDKNDIIRVNKVIPFRTEIDCESAMPVNLAVARVCERSIKTQVAVDRDKQKSVITIGANLKFNAEVYSINSLSIVQDAFSVKRNVALEKNCIEFTQPLDLLCDNVPVELTLPVDVDDAYFLATDNERVEIIEQQKGEGLTLSGAIMFNAYFIDQEGKIFVKKLESPFTINSALNIANDCNYYCQAKVERGSGKLNGDSLEFTCQLYLTVYPETTKKLTVISSVTDNGEKGLNDNAISVYIALEGESLWSISKRLNVTPENLVTTNKNLTFPLTGEERIVIYRQL